MVERARRSDLSGVHGVIGGFHMKGFSEKAIRDVIDELKRLGIKIAGPCHCSGDLTRTMFREVFEKGYVNVGVGTVIELEAPKEN
jgi:7,8-dihydropterin-6-yl-methyl-4-(beta-D-ribofuranosyl)aminobenzene 5'-phosphate synthase